MPLKQYKPTTPGLRLSSVDAFADITKNTPEKSLLAPKTRASGRSRGKIAVRHRGGGEKRFVRIVDFVRVREDPAAVVAVEYDPNRGARVALLKFPDGEKRYIIAPLGIAVGATLFSSRSRIEPSIGNRLPLEFIPIGTIVHAIALRPRQGAKIARGAGTGAQLLAIDGPYANVKMPSGEVRKFFKECEATVGQVGNADHRLIRYGKAGRMRHLGIRPRVRGKAMNPVDHPHGGGEGHNPIGLVHPKTPQGLPAFGVKTRTRKKWSNALIVQRRKS